jgi:hypothetical protein
VSAALLVAVYGWALGGLWLLAQGAPGWSAASGAAAGVTAAVSAMRERDVPLMMAAGGGIGLCAWVAGLAWGWW